MTLKVSVPPPPSQLIWENLQFSASTRFARRALVNAILLLQCALATQTDCLRGPLRTSDPIRSDPIAACQVRSVHMGHRRRHQPQHRRCASRRRFLGAAGDDCLIAS